VVSLRLVRADERQRNVGALNRVWAFVGWVTRDDIPEAAVEALLKYTYPDGSPLLEIVTGGTSSGEPAPRVVAQGVPVELPSTLPIKKNEEIENALGIQLTWDTWQRLSPQ